MARSPRPPVEYLPVQVGMAHLSQLVNFLRPKVGGWYVVGFDTLSTTYKVWEKVRSLRAAQKSLAQLQIGAPPWNFPVSSYIVFYSRELMTPWFFVYQGGTFPI